MQADINEELEKITQLSEDIIEAEIIDKKSVESLDEQIDKSIRKISQSQKFFKRFLK